MGQLAKKGNSKMSEAEPKQFRSYRGIPTYPENIIGDLFPESLTGPFHDGLHAQKLISNLVHEGRSQGVPLP